MDNSAGLINWIRKMNKLGKITKNRPNDINFLNYYKRYKNTLCSLKRNTKYYYYRNKVININSHDKNNNNGATKEVCNIIGELIKITEPFHKLYMKMN